jgi:hypothetical protein
MVSPQGGAISLYGIAGTKHEFKHELHELIHS